MTINNKLPRTVDSKLNENRCKHKHSRLGNLIHCLYKHSRIIPILLNGFVPSLVLLFERTVDLRFTYTFYKNKLGHDNA